MRLNLEISESQMAGLKALQRRTGAGSMKELINQSVSMLEWAADEVEKGNDVAAINEDNETFRVLITPLLQYVAKQSRTREREAVGA